MKYTMAFILCGSAAFADAPVITAATAVDGRFSVTLTHPDTGWDHYADGWRVEDADGTVLGLRVLAHPHVNEQPFTRSLMIDGPLPDVVYIRARDSIDGWAKAVFEIAPE